jgi:hypothetical protein
LKNILEPHAISVLAGRYRLANSHPGIVNRLISWQPKSLSNGGSAGQTRAIWILRFHPVFKTIFNLALRLTPIPRELELQILVAWKNTLPYLSGGIEKLNITHAQKGWVADGHEEGALFVCLSHSILQNFPNVFEQTFRDIVS